VRVLLFDTLNGFDYLQYASGQEYRTRVFVVLEKVDTTAGVTAITRLAKEALKFYGGRPRGETPRRELQTFFPPDPPAEGEPVAVVCPLPPPPAQLPPELVRALELYDTVSLHAAEVRSLFRVKVPPLFEPPFRFHLSARERERLTAILALERAPDPAYLWWLAERVTIETPPVGLMAAKALTAAALRLARAELRRLRSAVNAAIDRLNEVMESLPPAEEQGDGGEPPADEAATPIDPTVFKQELNAAIHLSDMRTVSRRHYLSPDDLEQFLRELVTAFPRPALEQVCQGMDFPLKRFARPEDPIEHCVVYLAIRARAMLWERDLIKAVALAQPANAFFQAIQQRYTAARARV
jgi:hypothetical protein